MVSPVIQSVQRQGWGWTSVSVRSRPGSIGLVKAMSLSSRYVQRFEKRATEGLRSLPLFRLQAVVSW